MRYLVLCVGLILVVAACQWPTRPDFPRAFTLGPGCWTQTVVETTLDDGRHATLTVEAHYATCPDSLAAGQTLWHWDTMFVAH